MIVLPPGRLSTMTCGPQLSVSLLPTTRATAVVLPPGAKGVMKRIGAVATVLIFSRAARLP